MKPILIYHCETLTTSLSQKTAIPELALNLILPHNIPLKCLQFLLRTFSSSMLQWVFVSFSFLSFLFEVLETKIEY